MPYIIINGVLYHHGIRGMRWGHRRFQNKDGTLTEAGKRRYASSIAKASRRNQPYKVEQQLREDFESGKFRKAHAEQIKKVYEAKTKYVDEMTEIEFGYEDSPEYDKAIKAAQDKALKYLRDTAPEDLEEIESIMRDTGRDYGDFKLVDDAASYFFSDEGISDQFRDEYCRRNGIDINASRAAYQKACSELTESVLGEYGNLKMPTKLGIYGEQMDRLSDYLGSAAADAAYREAYKARRLN